MKLHPEDPRLTAYVLGELGPEDAAAVEMAAATDPALQAEIHEMREMQRLLTNRLALPDEKLLPRQRENIRRSARDADRSGKIIRFRTWLIPAAAAAVALAAFALFRTPASEPVSVASKTPATPAVITPPNTPPPVLPPPVTHGSVAAADPAVLRLPVITGKANLETVSNSIRVEGKLPPRDAVRLEEILNAYPLRLNGVTAISRGTANTWHPDNRDSGMSAHVATLSTELIACPWKPSATLLIISLRGNARKDCAVKISFHANPDTVARYRLLGFNSVAATAGGEPPATLAANSMSNLAIEIESSKPGGELGSLQWSADDQPAPSVSLTRRNDAEPSDDARFAALVCTFAQWLAGEQAGIIDADIVAALAREIASTTLPADRADFLNLIDRSLNL